MLYVKSEFSLHLLNLFDTQIALLSDDVGDESAEEQHKVF